MSSNVHKYFSRRECLKGRDVEYPLTQQMEVNLVNLLLRLNIIREKYGSPLVITSLYRPGRYNEAAGGAKASAHLTCEACDFADSSGDLKKWLLANIDLLKELGLRLEDPARTDGWAHLDTKFSGKVVFSV